MSRLGHPMRPRIGAASISHPAKTGIAPAKMTIPVATSAKPMTFSTVPMCARKRLDLGEGDRRRVGADRLREHEEQRRRRHAQLHGGRTHGGRNESRPAIHAARNPTSAPMKWRAPAHIQNVLYKRTHLWMERENVGGKFRLIALAGLLSLLACQSSVAAELVMFRRVGCPYCLAWDRIIGPVYPKTELGRRVPVRMVDLDEDDQPKLDLQRAVRYTPTFVLVEGGRELGRIEGYLGEDFFGAYSKSWFGACLLGRKRSFARRPFPIDHSS